MKMEAAEFRQLIQQELPELLKQDQALEQFLADLLRAHFADRTMTDSRFDRLLDELRRDREEQARKWDEQEKKWDEQNRRWDEQNRRWDEQARKWDEQEKKWQENQAMIYRILDRIEAVDHRIDSTIGALGSRWGMYAEESFRSGLKAILEQSFGVEVLNVVEYDDQGEVFGRPDQVELDVIIHNGMLILAEIKSSMSRGDMYIFERKVRFYERRHQRQANRFMVISPMVDPRAVEVAKKLGIEVYSHAYDAKPEGV